MKQGVFMLIALMLLSPAVQAEDIFPEFIESAIAVDVPLDELLAYQEDLQHTASGDRLQYILRGQFFSDPAQGHIQTLAEGFSGNPTDRSTPWKMITELLAAYQKGDLATANSFYDPESLAYIEQALADPAQKEKYIALMRKISGIDVLLGFHHKNGFLAITNVHFDLGEAGMQSQIQPIFLRKFGDQYQMSRTVLDEPVDKNVAIFLKDHTVKNLVEDFTVASGYALTIEKNGDGSGTVSGDGIDCGDDCSAVYPPGTVVVPRVAPDADSVFTQWQVEGARVSKIEITNNMTMTVTFPMSKNMTVSVTFKKKWRMEVCSWLDHYAALYHQCFLHSAVSSPAIEASVTLGCFLNVPCACKPVKEVFTASMSTIYDMLCW